MDDSDDDTGGRGSPSSALPAYSAALAVALTYEPERDGAPRVVASGRGAVAEQILNIAFANGVRVREDADLAQLLAAIDIDSEIPVEAFAAVAEVLAYVYRANGRLDPDRDGDATAPSPAPSHDRSDNATPAVGRRPTE